MRNLWLIIGREYRTRVRKKSFILWTLLGPVFFILLMLLPVLMSRIQVNDQTILVVDESGLVSVMADAGGVYFTYDKPDVSSDSLRNLLFENTLYDGILYIPKVDPSNPVGIRMYSIEPLGMATHQHIQQQLAAKFEEANLQRLQLSKEEMLKIRPDVFIEDLMVQNNQSDKSANLVVATSVAYVMGFVTYIVLLIYGSLVMRGVMEEKSSRIVEVMISTVKPFHLMMGKIVGIGAVGLTQFFIWAVLLSLLQFWVPMLANTSGQGQVDSVNEAAVMPLLEGLEQINFLQLGVVFALFFLGGYFLYAALFAAVGSLVSDDDGGEVQMYSFPLTMLILISVFITTAVVQQPTTSMAFWASIIPFSSPMVMPALIAFGVPWWQVLLSFSILIAGFIGTTWLAGRIYRTGILMYGKKITVRDLWCWITSP